MAENNILIQQIMNAPIEIIDVPVVYVSCDNTECQAETQSLKDELENYNRKIADESKKYHQMLILNLKKDLVIRQLKKKNGK